MTEDFPFLSDNDFLTLVKLLEALKNVKTNFPTELSKLTIIIEGNQETGTFDAQLAHAIEICQKEIHKLAAKSLYGETASIKQLTDSDRKAYTLWFSTGKSSTKFDADLFPALYQLASKLADKLTSEQILAIVLLSILCFTGYCSFDRWLDSNEKLSLGELKLKSEQEQTLREKNIEDGYISLVNALNNVKVNKFLFQAEESGDKSAHAFAEAASGANRVTFGRKTFSKQDLEEIQKKKSPETSQTEIFPAFFQIVGIQRLNDSRGIEVTLHHTMYPKNIRAKYMFQRRNDVPSLSEEAGSMVVHELCNAIEKRSNLHLKIKLRRKGMEIVDAEIIQLLSKDDEKPSQQHNGI
jgi:hypothetical protein